MPCREPGGRRGGRCRHCRCMGISGYLMRQADRKPLACASGMLSHGFVAVPGSGPVSGQVSPWACEVELPSVSGQGADPRGPGPGPGPTRGSRRATLPRRAPCSCWPAPTTRPAGTQNDIYARHRQRVLRHKDPYLTNPLCVKKEDGGGFAAAVFFWAFRACYGAVPPASRLLRIACGDGLTAGLDPGASTAPGGRKSGQARACPAAARGPRAPRGCGRSLRRAGIWS
jgi:hypothetical protein